MRYEGGIHCAGLMWREEGLRGLYRGYFAFILATAIYTAVVPIMHEFQSAKQPIFGNYHDSSDELVDSFQSVRNMLSRNSKKKED